MAGRKEVEQNTRRTNDNLEQGLRTGRAGDEQLMEINPDYFADTAKDYELNRTIWLFQVEVSVTSAKFTPCMTISP